MKPFRSLLALGLALTVWGSVEARGKDARVRVVHASPDAPAVDVLVNGGAAFTSVAFGEISDYASLPAGVYDVEVVPAGLEGPAVIDLTGNAAPSFFYNRDYTAVAVNFLDQIEPLLLVDDNRPVSVPNTRVRFVHASPDAPAVDIRVVNGPYLFQNVPFKGVGDYLTVPRGTYSLEVLVAGTDTVALDLPNVMLDGGTTYTVFAVGTLGEGTLGVAVGVDNVSPARGRGPLRR